MSTSRVCLNCGGEVIANVEFHLPRCPLSRPSADAPPASAPRPEHVHTCTDPGPFIAQIAERDAEIARLREAGNRVAEWFGDTEVHGPGCGVLVDLPCTCELPEIRVALRALAGAAPKTETPRG